ncbi:MAG: DUF2147 domain-containing protein [Alphaproteobacteria bacterium]
MKITGLTCIALLAVLHAGGVRAASDTVFGFWLVETQRSIIEITPCGDSACGEIVWLVEPLDEAGQPRTDNLNSDDELRSRPLCGMEMISGFSSSGPGAWSDGSIYSPTEGKTYSASMKVDDDGTLKLRGYVLLPLFGKTQVWTREDVNRGGCQSKMP